MVIFLFNTNGLLKASSPFYTLYQVIYPYSLPLQLATLKTQPVFMKESSQGGIHYENFRRNEVMPLRYGPRVQL